MNDLPEPRIDGKCCLCVRKPAVTNDKRYCRFCLKRVVAKLTPMVGCYKRRGDYAHYNEGDNSFDNAVKVQEGGV